MKVIACYKVVPEDRDIVVKADRTLDIGKAQLKLGDYDLNAIEEAVRIAQETGGTAKALSFGDARIGSSKLAKAALSRGPEELVAVIDDGAAQFDSRQTASVLAAALETIDFDLVLCGEGSADAYAQQVGCQLGELLGIACFNAVSSITPSDGSFIIERTLEHEIEVLEVSAPAVLSVTSDINLPRIPQLKDILEAGKKKVVQLSLADLDIDPKRGVETVSTLAPESVERKQIVVEGASDENIRIFAQSLLNEM